MAYSKQTWSSNEPITADKLNHIENGIPTKTSQLANDSGFLTSHQNIDGKKNIQSAVSSPDASGTAVAFIDSISQDAQGVITPTKKTIATATILGELTKENVTTALGYTPPTANDVNKYEVLVVSSDNGVSALPYTIENTAIETDMVCVKAELSNPAAQANDWTVNTNNAGQAVISGTIRKSTNITIYLMKSNL